ncbi:MAG: Gfo/Idh/MocA family oxidoreductase [Chloroflexia bacterium]
MSNPVRVVIAGCGNISRIWFSSCAEMTNLDIVGIVDLDEAVARTRADQFGLEDVPIGTDLAAMLDRTQPDAVFDCTVPTAHRNVTLEALGRGIHVLGEKPLSDTMATAREMVSAAQASGKLYAVMQNRRFDANILRLREFLDSGAIGEVTTVESGFYIAAHFEGFRLQMEHVLLLDMAIHTFDAARLITRADPRTVYCHEWNPSNAWMAHGGSAIAIFEMSDNIVYTYHGSWCGEGMETPWEAEWRIIGTKGTVTWDGAEGLRAQVFSGRTEGVRSILTDLPIPPLSAPPIGHGHAGVIRDFVRCIQEGDTPQTLCTDNIKSLAMVFGAIASADSRQRVAIGA